MGTKRGRLPVGYRNTDTKRGRPKVSEFVEQNIAFKVMELADHYNETYYKAWFRFVTHKPFKSLMKDHYKNTSHPDHWVKRLTENFESQKKFYTKHIKKWCHKRSGIGSLMDWTIKYKLIKEKKSKK